MFGFRRDCSRSLVSTAVRDKGFLSRLCVILIPAEITLGRKQDHADSLCRKPFFANGSLGLVYKPKLYLLSLSHKNHIDRHFIIFLKAVWFFTTRRTMETLK